MDPESGIAGGCSVSQGDIIARVADVEKTAPMLPHLHLSLAWVPETLPGGLLTWDTLCDPALVDLCDPLEVFTGSTGVLAFDPGFNHSDIPRVSPAEFFR